MTDRAYTVAEIDDLRSVVDQIWLFGTLFPDVTHMVSRSYQTNERAVAVEQRVRTYMLAGITAEDIRAEQRERHDALQYAQRAWRTKAGVDRIIAQNIATAR